MLKDSMVVATIPVTDLDRAKRFYGETLGLTFLWENPASVRFGCGGGTQISVFRRGPSTADHTLSHFEVSDIEGVVRELESRDVTFIEYGDGPLQTTGHIAQIRPGTRGMVPRPGWQHPGASPGMRIPKLWGASPRAYGATEAASVDRITAP